MTTVNFGTFVTIGRRTANNKNLQFLPNQANQVILPTYSSIDHSDKISQKLVQNCGFL